MNQYQKEEELLSLDADLLRQFMMNDRVTVGVLLPEVEVPCMVGLGCPRLCVVLSATRICLGQGYSAWPDQGWCICAI